MANPRTIARIEAQIQRRAAHCLQFELSDPRSHFITITKVELSPDLSAGKIFYSVLGESSELNQVSHMLEGAAGYIQRQVASVLKLRKVPHLRWLYDESILESMRMDQLIRDALERDEKIHASHRPVPASDPKSEDESEDELDPEREDA